MRVLHLLAFWLATVLCVVAASEAQFLPPAMLSAMPAATGGGGYSGPCNVVSGCTDAYGSIFAPTAAAATGGNSAVDWSCTGGSPSSGTVKYISTGGLDTTGGTNGTAGMTTACGANAIVTTKFYDAIGSFPAIQSGAGQPQIKTGGACASGVPTDLCTYFLRSSSQFLNTGSMTGTFNQPYTFAAVIRPDSANTGTVRAIASSANATAYLDTSDNSAEFAGSAVTGGAVSNNTVHQIIAVFNGASSSICVDGSRTASLNPGSNAFGTNATFYIGYDNFSTDYFGGYIYEVQIWQGAALSTANQAALWSNAKAHYTGLSGAGTCS